MNADIAGNEPQRTVTAPPQGQKHQDGTSLYLARKVSPAVTRLLLRAGLSANQTTALWGVLSLLNCQLIYLAVTGWFWLLPVVYALFFVVMVLDCSDGEIARVRGTASPIAGKLLDGIWHKATEYGLLLAYGLGAYRLWPSPWVPIVGMVLVSGEAMYTYVYERRLVAIRLFAKSDMHIKPTAADDTYRFDEGWRDFSRTKKLKALRGTLHYKSAYFVILLSALSAEALLAGVVALTAYKHYSWFRLMSLTLSAPPPVATTGD